MPLVKMCIATEVTNQKDVFVVIQLSYEFWSASFSIFTG